MGEHAHVAISMGSNRARTVDAGAFTATAASFAPHSYLPPHTHDRAILSVMLSGSFTTTIGARTLECVPETMWTEPVAERHANRAGAMGARVVVIQPDFSDHMIAPHLALFDATRREINPRLALHAQRIMLEILQPDPLSILALQSLAGVMFVEASRAAAPERRQPAWVGRVRERLHDEFASPPTMAELAADAGVHISHLAHEFRRRTRMTVGEYARAVRLEWALGRLAHSSEPIAAIAATAGFSDQAHFTRVCRAETGTSPAAYRRATAGI